MHWSESQAAAGRPPIINLTSKILEGNETADPSLIPLLMDVDGAVAAANSVTPLLTGPSLPDRLLLSANRYWFPGLRHNGEMNVAFVDGHVKSTRRPLAEQNWAWDFDAGESAR
jgi:prepilin-type processing-associated H-X9-DG protein